MCIWASMCKNVQSMALQYLLTSCKDLSWKVVFLIFALQALPTMGGSGLTYFDLETAITAFSFLQGIKKKFSMHDKDACEISSFCSLYNLFYGKVAMSMFQHTWSCIYSGYSKDPAMATYLSIGYVTQSSLVNSIT